MYLVFNFGVNDAKEACRLEDKIWQLLNSHDIEFDADRTSVQLLGEDGDILDDEL